MLEGLRSVNLARCSSLCPSEPLSSQAGFQTLEWRAGTGTVSTSQSHPSTLARSSCLYTELAEGGLY